MLAHLVTNVQATWAARLIPAAATGAGLPVSSLPDLFKALPLGSAALVKVPGITTEVMIAAGKAIQESYVHALRVTALSSLSFGILAIIACILCNDIGHKVSFRLLHIVFSLWNFHGFFFFYHMYVLC